MVFGFLKKGAKNIFSSLKSKAKDAFKGIGGKVVKGLKYAKNFAIDNLVGGVPIVGDAAAALLKGEGLSGAKDAFVKDVVDPFKKLAKGNIGGFAAGIIDDIPVFGGAAGRAIKAGKKISTAIKHGQTAKKVVQKAFNNGNLQNNAANAAVRAIKNFSPLK